MKNNYPSVFKHGLLTAGLLISCAFFQGCLDMVNHASAEDKPQKGVDFRIAIIPDTQYYTAQVHDANIDMFRAQIKWIKDHHIDSSIVYVAGMGDIVDDWKGGDTLHQQWINAAKNGGYYDLETPGPGIPYGLAVGNHDEADPAYTMANQADYHHHPGLNPGRNTTENYNKYFGVDHFKDKPWYGGHANLMGKNNNDNHYDKFTVAGQPYIVVYLSYDVGLEDKDDLMDKWADSVVKANAKAKAIIVTHGMLKAQPIINGMNAWNNQGERIYNDLKDNKNILMFLCGHVNQGYRQDVYNGHTIRTFMSDYQGEKNGGDGKMRSMKINTVTDSISIRTFSPYHNQ